MTRMRTTAREIRDRWGIDAQPGDDPWDAALQILSRLDQRLDALQRQVVTLQGVVENKVPDPEDDRDHCDACGCCDVGG